MKIAPQDITPELLYTALREMLSEEATLQQKAVGLSITSALKQDSCDKAVWEIIDHIIDITESCYSEGFCFCQARTIFTIAFTCGVKMCNAHDDVKELDKMAK